MKKILIVDDEPHIRLLLQEILEEFEDKGVEILVAKQGKEALEMIVEHKPQLVFLDVMMPAMNGYDVCKYVKLERGITNITIIMLTAKGQVYDKEKALACGVDMYITKPFDPEYILQIAENIIK